MRKEELQTILNKANKGDKKSIHLRPLLNNIYLVKVWTRIKKTHTQFDPLSCYLIKNNDNKYVGIVCDMGHDLHWYVSFQHRKQGLLTKAMKEVILFHLFQNRAMQSITITESEIGYSNYQASLKVATALGFKRESDNTFILNADQYQSEELLFGQDTDITQERISEIKAELKNISYSLWKVQTEIEMALGLSDCTTDIKQLVDDINDQGQFIEDKYWDYKEINKALY